MPPGAGTVTDGLGSVRGVVDAVNVPLESRLYTPYGEPYQTTGTNQTVFGFTGEPTDTNGLVHLRARYYNPTLGVFPSLDPLEGDMGNPLGVNRYAYVLGNPVNRVDPSGLDAATACLLSDNSCITALGAAGAALGSILGFLSLPVVVLGASAVAVGGAAIYVASQIAPTPLTADQISQLISYQIGSVPPTNVAERIRVTAMAYASFGVRVTAEPSIKAPPGIPVYPDTTVPKDIDITNDTEVEWQNQPERPPEPKADPTTLPGPYIPPIPPTCTPDPSKCKIEVRSYIAGRGVQKLLNASHLSIPSPIKPRFQSGQEGGSRPVRRHAAKGQQKYWVAGFQAKQ